MTCTTECGADAWPDPLNPGQCLTDQKCRERNSSMSLGSGLQTRPYGSKCLGGCEYAIPPGTGITSTVIGGETLYSGEYEWTGGGTCRAAPPAPPAEEPKAPREQCTSIPGSDMTRCMRNDGSTCVSATSGAQICWKPGETGQKAHENIAQVANAGDQPIPPPNLNLPSGDALEPKGPPVNVSTTNNATNTTINTTIQNYQTVHGTNAGGNDGVPKPGEPGHKEPGPDGPKDGNSDDGTADGGEDCDRAPVVSDPMLGMVATQAWATRCAVEAGNAAKVTGDVGDCKSDYTVEGDNANAHQLRALRASICGAEKRAEEGKGERQSDAATFDSEADALEAEFGTNVFAEGDGTGISFNTGWWVAGGGSCPDISATLPSWAGGATWTPPPQFCQLLRWLSLLFQAIAMVWGVRIVMGR
ncbi:hypothetical protein LY625_01740 [Lysobacter sp. GX 14042]|uniref:hypothetical protein n=1 Tax=Lysobacter sp. GX 14042 TaxID=2907155 RepID=UPI001F481309|nr:hypothetical protein [Lysobacter sp. GX 14042]MCE7031359.1 hypothetical protein [Lysobacter sp. GX 14042]